MVRFLVLLAALFLIAFGFHQLNETTGEVTLSMGGTVYTTDLTTAVMGFLVAVAAVLIFLMLFRALVGLPQRLSSGWRRRNAEKARAAVSQGLIAIASGDQRGAERSALEASRRAPDEPLTLLLQAQTAQLRGDRAAARRSFEAMAAAEETRIAGLRGLYIEAEREGQRAAARQIAEQARAASAATPWAARAVLQHQSTAADWEGALRTLSGAADGRIIDKRTARRQRAVLLTALALDREDGDPDKARAAALEAHDLAPDLVPAAVVAGRLLARQGDIRRATKVLEETWKAMPHPEIADAYAHVRAGDSAADRLKRLDVLHRLRPQADEGRLALARGAVEARDFERARAVLKPVLTTRPTQNALLAMADLVQAETGDEGLAREWLARAVHAPRDPAWTADGMVLEHWAPVSPVSGRIDAVEWKVPLAELEGPALDIGEAELRPPQPHDPDAISETTEPELVSVAHDPALRGDGPASPTPPGLAAHHEAPAPAGAIIAADGAAVSRSNGNGADRDPAGSLSLAVPPESSDVSAEALEVDTLPRPPDDPGVDADEDAEARRRRLF